MSSAALLDDALLSVMVRLVTGGVLETAARGEPAPARRYRGPVPRVVERLIGAAHDAARVELGANVLGAVDRFDLIAALQVTRDQPQPRELLAAVRAALRPGGTFVAVEDESAAGLDPQMLVESGFADVTIARIDGDALHRYYVAR
jgi:hypothetical protein